MHVAFKLTERRLVALEEREKGGKEKLKAGRFLEIPRFFQLGYAVQRYSCRYLTKLAQHRRRNRRELEMLGLPFSPLQVDKTFRPINPPDLYSRGQRAK